jgi:hypothetical protein
MKRSRFSEEQIIGILKKHEAGVAVADLCLALVADTSFSGRRVARELDNIIRQRGQPETIVSDNETGIHL